MHDFKRFITVLATTAVIIAGSHFLVGGVTPSVYPQAGAEIAPVEAGVIQVDLSRKVLSFQGKDYQVAIGGPDTPTPTGEFQVIEISQDLKISEAETIPNTLSFGFLVNPEKTAMYAIHGGDSLGGSQGTTQGCVRLDDWAIAMIAPYVQKGTRIVITNGVPQQTQTIVPKMPDLAAAYSDIKVEQELYDIQGASEQELRSQMAQLGPSDPVTGKRFDAYARWYVDWSSSEQSQPDGTCRLSATVTARAETTMPRWSGSPNAPADLVQKWERYINALTEHEKGHIEHGRGARSEIEETLNQISGSCGTLASFADTTGAEIIQKYAQKDVEYDRATGHGASQGAVFP